MKRKMTVCLIVFLTLIPSPLFAANVYRDTNRFAAGVQRIFIAPFRLPARLLQGTFYGPPIVGTLSGALVGTAETVTNLAGGAFDMAAAAAPYAKYALFF